LGFSRLKYKSTESVRQIIEHRNKKTALRNTTRRNEVEMIPGFHRGKPAAWLHRRTDSVVPDMGCTYCVGAAGYKAALE